jgi:hypothetical protein
MLVSASLAYLKAIVAASVNEATKLQLAQDVYQWEIIYFNLILQYIYNYGSFQEISLKSINITLRTLRRGNSTNTGK